jgi:hypothetical protein
VASSIRDRTSEMVEALYNMNKVNPSLVYEWPFRLHNFKDPLSTPLLQFQTLTLNYDISFFGYDSVSCMLLG